MQISTGTAVILTVVALLEIIVLAAHRHWLLLALVAFAVLQFWFRKERA